MVSLRYRAFSESKFEIFGKDEITVATVERGEDNLWHILAKPHWVPDDGFNFGPFNSNEEAFEELGAVTADQS